ncbi:MAG: MarC family protein [Desulfobacterales bacterium]|nr:MarC family protein [Desulfobacterales bacterium]MDD4071784.1 MarC family protein [Desulfobacterales bacterium]MDD4393671.1 MarC family protein [Desulfobacterales bacterium]
MQDALSYFLAVWMKFFFIFTPFFALSMFLSMTIDHTAPQRRKLAVQTTSAVTVLCFGLYYFGNIIFAVFNITLDAFRVGAGALLFLSAIELVQAKPTPSGSYRDSEIAVVPLAIPIIVGPATIGTLLVLEAEMSTSIEKMIGTIALITAIASIGIILFFASYIESILGRRGINILSKMTGLILAALAAQMILSGTRHFFMAG